MNNYFWTDIEEAKLKAEFTNITLPPEYFEKIFERKWVTISVKARSLGLKRGKAGVRKTLTYRLPKEKIIQLYISGLSTHKIAKIYSCSPPTISSLLKEAGIVVKSNVETVKLYAINATFFDSIDTPDKAYFLGFIAADGYVNNKYQQLRITLHKDDIEVLENLKKAIGYTGQIKHRLMKSGNKWYTRVDLCMVNKHIVDSLNKLGIIQKKSLVLQFPIIDSILYADFLRGYFDGDGSVHKPNCFSLVGTEQFLTKCQEILMSNCKLNKTKLDYFSSIPTLRYNGKIQLKRIFDFLYTPNCIKLIRKYNKFLSVMSTNT